MSHGINYAVALGLGAIRDSVDIFLLSKTLLEERDEDKEDRDEAGIRLIYLNSDPYIAPRAIRDVSSSIDELNINIILCEEVDSIDARRKIYDEILKLVSSRDKTPLYRIKRSMRPMDFVKKWNKISSRSIESVASLIKILERGLLLPLIYEIINVSESLSSEEGCGGLLRNDLNTDKLYEIINYIDRVVDAECGENNELTVYRNLWLDPVVMKLFIASCVIGRELINKIDSRKIIDWAPLNIFKEIVDSPLIISRAAKTIAEREIDDIRCRTYVIYKVFGEELINQELLYKTIYDLYEDLSNFALEIYGDDKWLRKLCRQETPQQELREYENRLIQLSKRVGEKGFHVVKCIESKCDFDERNLYAHAGFEKNITCIKFERRGTQDNKDPIEIFVKYRDLECINRVLRRVRYGD